MAEAMEPEAAQAPLFCPMVGQRIEPRGLRYRGVKCGVEYCYMRHGRQGGTGGFDAGQIGGIMQRSQLGQVGNRSQYLRCDADTRCVNRTPVYDAMAHCGDVAETAENGWMAVGER